MVSVGARHLVEQLAHARKNSETVARQLFEARLVRACSSPPLRDRCRHRRPRRRSVAAVSSCWETAEPRRRHLVVGWWFIGCDLLRHSQ